MRHIAGVRTVVRPQIPDILPTRGVVLETRDAGANSQPPAPSVMGIEVESVAEPLLQPDEAGMVVRDPFGSVDQDEGKVVVRKNDFGAGTRPDQHALGGKVPDCQLRPLGSQVAHLHRPTLPQFPLVIEIPLLYVWCTAEEPTAPFEWEYLGERRSAPKSPPPVRTWARPGCSWLAGAAVRQ